MSQTKMPSPTTPMPGTEAEATTPREHAAVAWSRREAGAREAANAVAHTMAHHAEEHLTAFVERGVGAREEERRAALAKLQRTGAERLDEDERSPERSLAGLPMAVKDMLAVPGREPGCGLQRPLAGLVEGEHASLLRALESLGAERIGFTRMTALALDPSGWSRSQPMPINPWNGDHVPGGSSSGSGVAVAAGAAVLGIGSDTAGSIRIPASCLGITGWKPTTGLFPRDGALELTKSFDTLGFMARHATDLLVVAEALGRLADQRRRARSRDRRGRTPSAHSAWPARSLIAPPVRVTALADLIDAAEPSVRRALRDGLDGLEAAGARLERKSGANVLRVLDPPTLELLQAEISRGRAVMALEAGLLGTATARWLERGRAIADEVVERHRAQRAKRLRDLLEVHLPGDTCLALPTLAVPVPAVDQVNPDAPGFSGRTLYELTRCSRFVNYLGLPAVSVPVGLDRFGLPVGLQLVGAPGSDAALLTLAERLQSAADWHARLPASISVAMAAIDTPQAPSRKPS